MAGISFSFTFYAFSVYTPPPHSLTLFTHLGGGGPNPPPLLPRSVGHPRKGLCKCTVLVVSDPILGLVLCHRHFLRVAKTKVYEKIGILQSCRYFCGSQTNFLSLFFITNFHLFLLYCIIGFPMLKVMI